MIFGLILDGFFLFGYITGGNSFPTRLPPEEERKCLEQYAQGCEDAKNKLIEHNLRLVSYTAKRYSNHAKDAEDLISVGTIGLIKGITKFEPTRGVKLSTFVVKCIENEILMFIRNAKKSASDVSLQEVTGADHEGNEIRIEDKLADKEDPIEEQVSMKAQIKHLRDVVYNALFGREKTVIEMRYGLNPKVPERTQREIADELKISRSYVSRIEKKALEKLRAEMEKA